MENQIFDVLFFQNFETNKKLTNRNYRDFVHRKSPFWGKSFLEKSRDVFGFSSCYLSAKGLRELKIKASGAIFHGEIDVR